MDNIFRIKDVDFEKIVYGEPVIVEKNKYISVKLWYDFGSKRNKIDAPETFFVRNPELCISGINKGELSFNLNDTTKELYDFYSKLDVKSISYIESNSILKKYNLKGVTYRTIINQCTDDENLNFFRTRLIGGKSPTKVFDLYRNLIESDRQSKFLEIGNKVKTIVEPDAIVIDLQNKRIFTNIILRQVLVVYARFMEPKKIELSDYSFADSDDENTVSIKCNNDVACDINDTIMNTQTECLNNSPTNETDDESLEDDDEDIELSPINSDDSIGEYTSDDSDNN